MEFTFESQGNESFLVYKAENMQKIDSLTLGMLVNNRIPGIAPAISTQINDTRYIKYNISSKVSVEQMFTGVVKENQFLGILSGITDALSGVEAYMIPQESVVLDIKYMYADVSTYETSLVCIPIIDYHNEESLETFLKKLMINTRFDSSENCDYVAKILNFLNESSKVDIAKLKELIQILRNGSFVQKEVAQQIAATQMQQGEIFNNANVVMQDIPGGMQQGYPAMPQQNVPQTPYVQPQNSQMNHMQNQNSQVQVQNNRQMKAKMPAMQKPIPEQGSASMPGKTPIPAIKKSAQGFAIPGQPNEGMMQGTKPGSTTMPNGNAASNQNEDKISLGYLLMHYSAENMAKYKAQKGNDGTVSAKEQAKLEKLERKEQEKLAKKAKKNKNTQMPQMPPMQQTPQMPPMQQTPQTPPMQQAPQMSPMQQTPQTPPMQQAPQMSPMQQTPQMPPMQQESQTPQVQQITPSAVLQVHKMVGSNSGKLQEVKTSVENSQTQLVNNTNVNFGETTVLGNNVSSETTVLSPSMLNQQNPHLIRRRNNERIEINKPVFRIGKERSYVDYFIGDNPAISRGHANIITRENKYYIIDTNSTNHTFIEGRMIPPNQEIELEAGKTIKLANEEFEFHL